MGRRYTGSKPTRRAFSSRALIQAEHQLLLYHCRSTYVFLVDGRLFEGWFAMPALDRASAEAFADALNGQTFLVKYDPRKPKDSVVEGKEVLGRKVIQDTNIFNPKV
jgi:hypothetical protein